jgi:hypothetical protein
MGGPPSKPKYSLVTDSEQVPWGKGEKNPDEGSEIESETECLQAVGAGFVLWRRTFCIMGQRVSLSSKLKPLGVGVAKASLNRAFKFDELDPKPSDLAMARLKAQ